MTRGPKGGSDCIHCGAKIEKNQSRGRLRLAISEFHEVEDDWNVCTRKPVYYRETQVNKVSGSLCMQCTQLLAEELDNWLHNK